MDQVSFTIDCLFTFDPYSVSKTRTGLKSTAVDSGGYGNIYIRSKINRNDR